MPDSYEATFRWPHQGASDVIVTGSFDSWSCSHHLSKSPSGFFQGTIQIPWGETVQYKYIVDGRWTTTDDQPTELDPIGNLNNVLRTPARPPSPKPRPVSPSAEGVLGKVNGYVETARQAMVGMVEAIAPGTTQTPAETPVTEAPARALEASTPAVEVKPAPEPEPEPEPSEPEQSATELVSEAVLPASPVPAAPEVPVPVLPLSTEAPSDAGTLPSADVSESKPLETTIVEGSTTAETAVESTPAVTLPLTSEATAAPTETPAPAADVVTDVAASKPLETTIVEGSTTAETAVAPAAAPVSSESAEEKPSTHTPAGVNGTSAAEKPSTNGTAPPTPTKTTTNGTTPTTPAKGTPSPPGSNGTSPASTPGKEKKAMRFPSLSSRRSAHARSRSSADSGVSSSNAGEFGEVNGNGNGKEKNGSVASRLGGTERAKRRTSLFGKLKDVFHHKHEASA
ncbi:hypothetical protein GY45DRAFT_1317877 [Cubamyces sp. BRFM 1775]|nr:hypothetical protein GY45DRAFT_1317877 [Cubamyces sp. BRFM 1775]